MKSLNAKHTSIIFALGLSLMATNQCLAQMEPKSVSGNHELLTESTCADLKLRSERRAEILIDGEWYLAEVTDSPHADGGDLDNMTLKNQSGQVVAERSDVAAYDMVVLALAGGNAKLRQKLVP